MDSKYYVTTERLEELKSELEESKTNTRLEIADALKRAKEYGDLSENAEYAQAREEQSRVETRIAELEELVKKAVIIAKAVGSDLVQVGSHVTVKKGDKVSEYAIVGSSESKPEEGRISNDSPIGRALIGHKVGDSVMVKMPAGEATYQIMKLG